MNEAEVNELVRQAAEIQQSYAQLGGYNNVEGMSLEDIETSAITTVAEAIRDGYYADVVMRKLLPWWDLFSAKTRMMIKCEILRSVFPLGGPVMDAGEAAQWQIVLGWK